MSRKRFEGKVAIVTGGSMGVGRSTCIQLAEEGAHVVTCARRKPKLDELVESIESKGGSITAVGLDVGDTDAFAKLITDTAEKHGRLDVLVNNAPSVIGGMVTDQSLEDWRANFGIGVDSVFIGVQAALRIMQPQGNGSIINISSLAAVYGLPYGMDYVASKAAVIGMTRAMARELGKDFIRVNAVAPSAVMTEGTQEYFGDKFEKAKF